MSADAPASPNGPCSRHPDRVGSACPRCGSFACPECLPPSPDGAVCCPACAARGPRERDFGAELLALVGAIPLDLIALYIVVLLGTGLWQIPWVLHQSGGLGARGHPHWAGALKALLPVLAINLPAGAFGLLGGRALRAFRPIGRWLATIGCILLPFIASPVVGVAVGLTALWALHRQRGRALFQPSYRQLVAEDPTQPARRWRVRLLYAALFTICSVPLLATILSHVLSSSGR